MSDDVVARARELVESVDELSRRDEFDGHKADARDPTGWYGGWGYRVFPLVLALKRHTLALCSEVVRLRKAFAEKEHPARLRCCDRFEVRVLSGGKSTLVAWEPTLAEAWPHARASFASRGFSRGQVDIFDHERNAVVAGIYDDGNEWESVGATESPSGQVLADLEGDANVMAVPGRPAPSEGARSGLCFGREARAAGDEIVKNLRAWTSGEAFQHSDSVTLIPSEALALLAAWDALVAERDEARRQPFQTLVALAAERDEARMEVGRVRADLVKCDDELLAALAREGRLRAFVVGTERGSTDSSDRLSARALLADLYPSSKGPAEGNGGGS